MPPTLQLSSIKCVAAQAENPRAVAEQYVDSLTESFFYTANAYLSMVRWEG